MYVLYGYMCISSVFVLFYEWLNNVTFVKFLWKVWYNNLPLTFKNYKLSTQKLPKKKQDW